MSADAASLTPLQRAFLALEQARARIAELEGAAREPIAVIGLGCRVPGGGHDAESFWRLMREGRDAVGPVPPERWDMEAFYDPDPEVPGRIATRAGGFLRDPVDRFDAGAFGIAPREAASMDPQQRLLLEVCWEALEHAAQAPDALERSRTGVFIGAGSSDYTYLLVQSRDPALLDAHFGSGIAHSVFSGRLSYLLGLQGPSITIDTACSSSLVAVHLACQSLRSGECRMALAGGVNLMLAPDLYVALSHSRMLAPDGRCKTFDARADGFGRAEGCGVVVLKRLADARADGDRILAVIRGTAVNQDGPSSSLTAPNGPAQEAVIREALANAGVAPAEVGYIETHGTGTELGDPLEVQALGNVFGPGRDPGNPLVIGSVKTNIGHLEAAAGVTGLIKLVLALFNRTIPAHLHFTTPSPHIPWGDCPLKVPTEAMPWPAAAGKRMGGVSAFGFSGTNAHVVVEEAPAAAPGAATPAPTPRLMTLSAHDETALAELARSYAAALEARSDDELADICDTANCGRAHLGVRATVIAASVAQLRERLLALAGGEAAEGVRQARVGRRDPPRVAFLFTGQGSQHAGMARRLYETEPVFRAALDRCAQLLAPLLPHPLLEVLFPAEGQPARIDETAYTQPALFALEHALAELWRSWGIAPNVVMGHSVGEYSAACAAGVLDLEPALALIAERGRLMQTLPPGGAMAAIYAPEADVAAAIAGDLARVSIAAINGPAQTVITGEAEAVRRHGERFAARGVQCKPLAVSHAFHSPLVEPVLDAFEREAAKARFASPRVRLVSNLTGRVAEAAELAQPRYWRRHMREAVRFGDGLATLAALKPDVVLEIGPHPTLLTFAQAALEPAPLMLPSLRRGRDDREQVLDSLAQLYLAGAPIDWRAVGGDRARRVVDLPTYPFQRERHWFKAAPRADAPRGRATGHPLLGTRLRNAAAGAIFESCIGADSPAFVREHRVLGHVVLPATAYLEHLAAAGRELLGTEHVSVEGVAVREAMLLDDDGAARVVQAVAEAPRDGGVAVTISSDAAGGGGDEPWVEHVSAQLRVAAPAAGAGPDLEALRARCPEAIDPREFYAGFERRGLDFGDAFHTLRTIRRGEGQALGEVELGQALHAEATAYRIHPVLLDGCLQVIAAALPAQEGEEALYLPLGIGRYTLHRPPGTRCWSHVTVQPGGGESQRTGIRVFDGEGRLAAELEDVQLKRATRDALERLGRRGLDEILYETRWPIVPAQGEAVADPAPAWSPADLAHAASDATDSLGEAAGIAAYDEFLPRLESLCAQYTVRAMQRLGWAPAAGELAGPAPLAERLRVAPSQRRLFGRLLAILAEDGWLAREGEGFRVRRAWGEVDPLRVHAELTERFPSGAAELELTGRVAGELAEALRGEREPMQLLFPGGSLDTAERMYRDAPTAKLYNGLMAEVMAGAAAMAPAGRPLRILEIGAGTGGTTAHVLPRLPAHGVEYTFTDVGPLFVARARERFGAGRPGMRFEVLDLERDPEAQGFAGRRFDIVIASNVIHATADLRTTLARVRRLLAPGGLLAMLEVTAPQRWFDLTVGITEGWWAFTDTDLRPDYATMPRERWLALLGECGFDSAAALPAGEDRRGCLGLQSLLLARAAGGAARDWLLVADRGGVAAALAAKLRARGERCTLLHPGAGEVGPDDLRLARAEAGEYRKVLAGLRASGRMPQGVVHATSLDSVPADNLGRDALVEAQQRGVMSVLGLAQALVAENAAARLWLLTRGAQPVLASDRSAAPAQAPVVGLAKALALEHPELKGVCIDLDPGTDAAELDALAAELAESGAETLVGLRAGGRHVARLARRRHAAAGPAAWPWRLKPAQPGSLDAFERAALERRAPGAGEIEIQVHATGLNFKDVLNALGMYPGDPGPLGGECAGRVSAVGPGVTRLRVGDPVLALAGGSFASHVIARAAWTQPLAPQASMEEAASFGIAYVTAEFCLGHLAKLGRGERVLIHAAAGGVGMAAVRLAQRAGAEVFATAGSNAKRELVRAMGVAHVLDSRSAAFAEEVLALTGGRGVDVVLNSLAGEPLEASFRAIGRGGRFVEIGKRGIKTQAEVDAMGRGLAYFVVDWGATGEREPELIGGMLEGLVEAWRTGSLPALPRHVFALDEAPRAFRFMAQARHAGRIVLRHGEPGPVAIRRDATYLVTGGLSGLGLEVARWLAGKGAGRLVLAGRRGMTPEAATVVDALRALGTTVDVEALDVSDEAGLRALLGRVRADGPALRGIVHSAGALADAALLQQDEERFARVFAPKLHGAHLLDALTRGDPLDFFVLFSSVAAVLGSPGQANHCAANAWLDMLAHDRRGRGLPALSINWGPWADIGAAADRGMSERLAAQGLGEITPAQGIAAMQRLMDEDARQASVLSADWPRFIRQRGGASAFLAELAGATRVAAAASPRAPQGAELRQRLEEAPDGRRRAIVAAFLHERAQRALGLDPARAIDPRRPLGELGLDSLLAVELRNTLGNALGRQLPATLLFDYPTLEALSEYVFKDVLGLGAQDATPPEAAQPAGGLVESIEDLSDDEVDRLLAQRGKQTA